MSHDDDTVHSGSSLAHYIVNARRSVGKRISATLKRNSLSNIPHLPHYHHHQVDKCFQMMNY